MADIQELPAQVTTSIVRSEAPTARRSRPTSALRPSLIVLRRSSPRFAAQVADIVVDDTTLDTASLDAAMRLGDPRRAAKGIALGLAIVLPFWSAVGFAIFAVLR